MMVHRWIKEIKVHYKINVSKWGQHLFATAEHSLTNEKAARAMVDLFKEKFLEEEGYKISLTRYETRGYSVDIG